MIIKFPRVVLEGAEAEAGANKWNFRLAAQLCDPSVELLPLLREIQIDIEFYLIFGVNLHASIKCTSTRTHATTTTTTTNKADKQKSNVGYKFTSATHNTLSHTHKHTLNTGSNDIWTSCRAGTHTHTRTDTQVPPGPPSSIYSSICPFV